jgi:hypothetical protein
MGLGFCGTNLSFITKKRYILVCTDYVTKWVEEKSLRSASEESVIDFLYEDIFTRFGIPREIVTDNGAQFTSNSMQALTQRYQIKHYKYSPYHPQENGQVESTNKVLEVILTKTVQQHHKDWADRLLEALWAYRTTWRNTTGFTPYELVYGKHVLLPIELQVKTFRTTAQLGIDLSEAQKQRIAQLNELDEIRQDAVQHTVLVQEQRARWHDKFIKKKVFKPGDWALLFYSRFKNFRGKLTTRWMGPYEIDTVFDNGSVKLTTIDDRQHSFVVNGHRLRLYHRPTSKDNFV